MGDPSTDSFYPNLKCGTLIAKSDQDKLKQIAEQLKFVFATKIKIKDNNLEKEIKIFIFNIQDYSLLKIVDDHE